MQNAEQAWMFVLTNASTIDRIASSRRFARDYSDPDDFRQDLVADLVTAFHHYDAARGTPGKWIFTRAQLTLTRHTRAWVRHEMRHEPIENHPSIASESTAAAVWERKRDARVRVEKILAVASVEEADAAMSILEGWNEAEYGAILGITKSSRNYRIRRLRERLMTPTKERTDEYEAAA